MKALEDKIRAEGEVLTGDVLKVGSFLNQQVDTDFMNLIGQEGARIYKDAGITKVLCTDISRDGTLQGPSTALYRDIMARYPHLQLIASGGVGNIADIAALDQAKVPAVVFGKAWYEGKITAADIQPYINSKER